MSFMSTQRSQLFSCIHFPNLNRLIITRAHDHLPISTDYHTINSTVMRTQHSQLRQFLRRKWQAKKTAFPLPRRPPTSFFLHHLIIRSPGKAFIHLSLITIKLRINSSATQTNSLIIRYKSFFVTLKAEECIAFSVMKLRGFSLPTKFFIDIKSLFISAKT